MGYGWEHIDTTDNSVTTSGALVGVHPGTFNPPSTFEGSDSSATIEGVLGGGQIGYNIQMASFVFGVEGAFHFADLEDRNAFLGSPQGPQYQTRSSIDYFGTVTARLGYAVDRVLLYGLAGIAIAHGEGRLDITPGTDPTNRTFSDSSNATFIGLTVGGGVEMALSDAWSAKIEYQYSDLGSERLEFNFANSDGSSAATRADIELHHIKAGLNYRF